MPGNTVGAQDIVSSWTPSGYQVTDSSNETLFKIPHIFQLPIKATQNVTHQNNRTKDV